MEVKNNSINMIYLLIIFGLIGNQCPVNAQLSNIDTLEKFAADSYDTMKSIYDTHSESSSPSTADIMDKVKDIIASIDKWDDGFKEKLEAINPLISGVPLAKEEIKPAVDSITKFIERIDSVYGVFKKYVETPDSLSEDDAGRLPEFFTSGDDDSVISISRDMYSMIYPETWGHYKVSPFILFARKIHEGDIPCGTGNPKRILMDFSLVTIITEMRVLVMTEYGYLMKGIKENVDYTAEMKMAGEKFMQRVDKYLLIFRNVLKVAGTQFRPCDPPGGYKRGKTFYEFERFLQAVVANEVILTESGDCSLTCDTVDRSTKMYRCDGITCDSGIYSCVGSMRYCKTMNWKADFCANPSDHPRRYQWIKDGWDTLRPLGSGTECSGRLHYPRFTNGWVYECDICRCICADDHVESFSSHFISMREQLSDVAKNMVVVGLKFRMEDEILHVDIQQAPLGSKGTIDEDYSDWKRAEHLRYDRALSQTTGSYEFYKEGKDGSPDPIHLNKGYSQWDDLDLLLNNGGDSINIDRLESFKNLIEGHSDPMYPDKDVAVLSYDSRRIHLDKLTAPADHLITGIRFGRDTTGEGQPVYLEIQATPFDYESGKLDAEKSIWIGPKDTPYGKAEEERTEYKGEGFRNPEKSKNTMIDAKPNTFIDLDWSNWNHDISQTVIPLLDGTVAASDPPTPLTGIGLYHKKEAGYGGFLTFVVEGLDMGVAIKHPRTGI